MRPLAYLGCVLLVAPVVAFTMLHDAIMAVAASDTLGALIGAIWRGLTRRRPTFDALPIWGINVVLVLIIASFIGFVALAFSARHSWLGFGLLALVGIVLTALVFVRDGAPPSVGYALLHLPALACVALALWMLSSDPRVASLRGGSVR